MLPGEEFEAQFYSLHVYDLRGFSFQNEPLNPLTIAIRGHLVAIGSDPNVLSESLAGESFTEDLAEWKKGHPSIGPYVMVRVGPTERHSSGGDRFIQFKDGEILTYDSFGTARLELKGIEKVDIPFVTTAIASCFASATYPVKLKYLDRCVFGLTEERRIVHDNVVGASAEGFVSMPAATSAVEDILKNSAEMASRLHETFAKFFDMGLREDDPLKRFLFFFLAVEREVHRVFLATPADVLEEARNPAPVRLAESITRFEKSVANGRLGIVDRFIGAALATWTQLRDADVTEFVRLKDIRDGIAHGSNVGDVAGPAAAIEALARRLVSART
jgi:hypothetical protein